MDIYGRIVDLLVTKFEIEPDDIGPEAVFEDLALDSLHLMELSLTLSADLNAQIDEGVLRPEQSLVEAGRAVAAATVGETAPTAP